MFSVCRGTCRGSLSATSLMLPQTQNRLKIYVASISWSLDRVDKPKCSVAK
jgi:hypothetical protein